VTTGEYALEIVLLGTGTSIPHPERASPACFVRAGSVMMLFDIGSGSLRRLAEAGFSYLDIDYIFLTHFHPDHLGDLVPLLFAFRNPFHPRTRKLTICGPHGMGDHYRGLREVYGIYVEPKEYDLELVEVDESFRGEDFAVSSINVPHTGSSRAYRLESDGKSIVLSGDTEYSHELVELSRGADLVLYECSFRDGMDAEGHLTPAVAARMAEEAGVGTLVLTHFYPVFDGFDIGDECRNVFKGKVIMGEDLLKFQL
jgi:ribonuclease BN (tRNA processing enzyme)